MEQQEEKFYQSKTKDGRRIWVITRTLGDLKYYCGYLELLAGDEYYQLPSRYLELDPEITFAGKGIEVNVPSASENDIYIVIDTADPAYNNWTMNDVFARLKEIENELL